MKLIMKEFGKKCYKRKNFIFLGILAIVVILVFINPMWKRKFPENEWHSRRGCRLNLLQIKASLKKYLKHHDNRMPNDLYKLVEKELIHASRFVCPSQYIEVKKASQDAPCSSVASSYKIVAPSVKLDQLEDGMILVEELKNNHPASNVGDVSYPKGYYVILVKEGDLVVEFIEE